MECDVTRSGDYLLFITRNLFLVKYMMIKCTS